MLHPKTLNNKIYRLHERVLRIIYSDYKSSFKITFLKRMALFESIIEISLAIEIYKFLHDLSPPIVMGNIIKLNKPPTCNLRTHQELYSRNLKTVMYGMKTFFFLAIVPQNIKNCSSLSSFKLIIRKWKPDCPYRLCKCILKHVGFI